MEETPRVLVVDDDLAILGTVMDVLAMEDIPARSTSNSLTVEGILRETEIAVVVSDINMPNLDGLELLQRIQVLQSEIGRSIRVVILTGAGSEERGSLAVSMGAWRYMPKPFDIDDFVACIREAMGEER